MKATDKIKKGDKTRYKIEGYKGVYRRGNQVLIKFRLEGKTNYQPTGLPFSVPNLRLAERKLIEIEDQIAREVFSFSTTFPKSKKAGHIMSEGNTTFGDMATRWYDSWLSKNSMKSEHSKRGHLTILNNHFYPKALCKIPLKDLTKAHLVEWHKSLVNQKDNTKALGCAQVNKTHTVCAFVCSFAHGLEAFTGGNPWAQFKAYYESHLKPEKLDTSISAGVPLSRKELDTLGAQQINNPGLDMTRNAMGFNALVGLRSSELLGLTWDRVDLKAGTIDIDRQIYNSAFVPCKSGSERKLQLSNGALNFLKLQHAHMLEAQPTDMQFFTRKKNKAGQEIVESCTGVRFVFFNPASGRPYTDLNLYSRRYYQVLEICKIPDITTQMEKRKPYTLRHTCASRMLTNGAPIEVVAAQLGNTAQVCRDKYARIITEDQKFNVELTNQYLA